jgi:hypothetical protein
VSEPSKWQVRADQIQGDEPGRCWDHPGSHDAADKEQNADNARTQQLVGVGDFGRDKYAYECAKCMRQEGEEKVTRVQERHGGTKSFRSCHVCTCGRWDHMAACQDKSHIDQTPQNNAGNCRYDRS